MRRVKSSLPLNSLTEGMLSKRVWTRDELSDVADASGIPATESHALTIDAVHKDGSHLLLRVAWLIRSPGHVVSSASVQSRLSVRNSSSLTYSRWTTLRL